MTLLQIKQGTVYDPTNGIDGEVRDIWVRDGVVVPEPAHPLESPDRVLDAQGLVVMPGGVDMHSHIAGPKDNVARRMRPYDKRRALPFAKTALTRSGTVGSVPSTFATGYLYAGMGYTTAFDAAIPPIAARHAHEEFQDTPAIDKGFFVLFGNNQFALRQIASGNEEKLRAFVGWLLTACKGYGMKVVNPGGVEVWKQGGANITGLDSPVPAFNVTPRQIITSLAQTAMDLGLPHPVHIHCNNLGMPGNWKTTLDTMMALEGRRGHLTHIQFHSYGGGPDDQGTFCSHAPELVEFVNHHPNITVDVGQVLFGETTSMTGDSPLGYYLHKVTGRKWFDGDMEMEAGCGIVPITYHEKSFVHALQWAIGLEWYLLAKDPWRIAMSTDHPNGASFVAYPQIIQLLMDRTYRDDLLSRVHPRVKDRSVLKELAREYTLYEIAIITRAAPARILGLGHKGHLGPGADGDVTIYQPSREIRSMFELPRYVLKKGQVIVEKGEIRRDDFGQTIHVAPEFDAEIVADIEKWFAANYTIQLANYPVDESYLTHGSTRVPCRNN